MNDHHYLIRYAAKVFTAHFARQNPPPSSGPLLCPRDSFAVAAVFESDHALDRRRMVIESLLTQIASPPTCRCGGSCGWHRGAAVRHWRMGIRASLLAVENDPESDFKDWLHRVTSPYRRLRHADQHRVILEAYLTKALPLPVLLSRAINATTGHLPHTIQNEGYPYSQQIVTRVRMQKGEFQQSWIPQARAWSDSFFGPFSRARQQTMNTLQQHGKGHHYGAYRALAEEADAFAVQTQSNAKSSR